MSKLSLRASSCLALLIAVTACGDGAAGSADTTAQFTTAADALTGRLEAAAKQGQVPPTSDPAVKAFEGEAARAMGALGTPALPLDGFDSFQTLCGKTATVVGAYLTIGAGQGSEAEKAAAMERSATQNLDRIFTPLLFSARCSAAHMPFLEKTVGSDVSEKKAALQQVRDGAFSQMVGLLQMAGDNNLDPARRRKVADLLAADSGNFAVVLSPAQRQQLAGMAGSLAGALPPEIRGQVEKAGSALQSAPCNALCKM